MRTRAFLLMVLVLLSFYAGSGVAQPISDGDIPTDVCTSLRDESNCRPAPLSSEDNATESRIQGRKVEVVRKITLPAQQPPENSTVCEASFEISYTQMDDQVRVETEVENQTCVASHGQFTLRVRTRSATGEISTRSFSESWLRTDEGPRLETSVYPMAGATDLIWVMINSEHGTACVCD